MPSFRVMLALFNTQAGKGRAVMPYYANPDYQAKLALEVETRNNVNAKCNEVAAALIAYFNTLEGCKVQNADGRLSKKVAQGVDAILASVDLKCYRYYVEASDYSVCFNIDTTYSWREGCSYVKACAYVASLRNGVVCNDGRDRTPRKCDYDVNAILAGMLRINDLEEEISNIKREICEFTSFNMHS